MFRRLVVFFFHGAFSLLAEECRLKIPTASIVAAPSANGVFSKWPRGKRRRLETDVRIDAAEVCAEACRKNSINGKRRRFRRYYSGPWRPSQFPARCIRDAGLVQGLAVAALRPRQPGKHEQSGLGVVGPNAALCLLGQ